MKDKDLFETKAQGYKVENGKLVYFSNMLNGYKHEYKDLQEICEEMNGLLKKFDSYEEQLIFWKGKAEEKLPENAFILTNDNAEELANLIVTSPQMQSVMEELIKAWQKETADKFYKKVKKMLKKVDIIVDGDEGLVGYEESAVDKGLTEIAKQFGVEIKE